MEDYLKVAKECGAVLTVSLQDRYCTNTGGVAFGRDQFEAYTSRILASQQAAHDAEIAKLKEELREEEEVYNCTNKALNHVVADLSTANERNAYLEGLVALQADALNQISPFGSVHEHCVIANKAISASSETVQAFRDKLTEQATEAESDRWSNRLNWVHTKHDVDGSGCDSGDALDVIESEIKHALGKQEELTEPLRREVAMLSKDATRWKKIVALASHFPAPLESASQQQGRGLFVMYEGSGVHAWLLNLQDETLVNFVDNQNIAVEDNTQATAEQFIAECEQRGAFKALDMVIDICESEGAEPNEGMSDFADGYDAACKEISEQVKLIRATSKKAG